MRVVEVGRYYLSRRAARTHHAPPAGGPLKIDVGVAELLLAQLAIMCAPRNHERETEAIAQRKIALESLDATQRGHARTVCSILLRLLDEAEKEMRASATLSTGPITVARRSSSA